MIVQKSHYEKFVGLLQHGLVSGLGVQKPGQMCIEAAWCCALGLPHGDDPRCVGSAVRADAADAAYAAARDAVLCAAADMALGILIDMKSPGCEYLYLADTPASASETTT